MQQDVELFRQVDIEWRVPDGHMTVGDAAGGYGAVVLLLAVTQRHPLPPDCIRRCSQHLDIFFSHSGAQYDDRDIDSGEHCINAFFSCFSAGVGYLRMRAA